MRVTFNWSPEIEEGDLQTLIAAAVDATAKADSAEAQAKSDLTNALADIGVLTNKSVSNPDLLLTSGAQSGFYSGAGGGSSGFPGNGIYAPMLHLYRNGLNMGQMVIDVNGLYYRSYANGADSGFKKVFDSGNFDRPESRSNGAIGTTGLFYYSGSAAPAFGSIYGGSLLRPSNTTGSTNGTSGVSGSWRCMGYFLTNQVGNRITLFMRVS